MEKLSSLHQLEDEEVMLIALAEADQLDDVGVIRSSHDLHLLQDVGTLFLSQRMDARSSANIS
jgi:hypothetical protein